MVTNGNLNKNFKESSEDIVDNNEFDLMLKMNQKIMLFYLYYSLYQQLHKGDQCLLTRK